MRANKLPKETGGVLLGSYDMQRKMLYIIDSIFAPPDSEEYPCAFIRGKDGLKDRLKRVESVTGKMVAYVGEWHSHPSQAGCEPSEDDRKVFAWIAEEWHLTAILR